MNKDEEKSGGLPPSEEVEPEDAEEAPSRVTGEHKEETEATKTGAAPVASARRPPGAPPGAQPGRYRGREGYPPDYPPGPYPPGPGGEGYPPGMPPYGGAPWQHPYGPPAMNYPPPMYPYQHPPPYPPGYGPPPPYYQDPRYAPEMPPSAMPPPTYGGEGPVPAPAPPREKAQAKEATESTEASASAEYYEEEGELDKKLSGPDSSSASRARLYVKSKVPTRQEVLDRRSRKNAQSRSRAAKLRVRVAEIEAKPASERTEEEAEIFQAYQQRRYRKNDRSRERAIEKKSEIDRILSKPDKKRTKIENEFLRTALSAKQRKNEGDRIRRQRIKAMKKAGMIPGYVSGMPDIPMSPLPPALGRPYPGHHAGMASPGTFASPGLMGFPSPPNARRGDYRGHPHEYMPMHPYGHPSPAARAQYHMHQRPSEVNQHRHPDGSVTISIGRGGNGGPPYGGEQQRLTPPPDQAGAVNMPDNLFYDMGGGQQQGTEEGEEGGAAEGQAQSEPDDVKDSE